MVTVKVQSELQDIIYNFSMDSGSYSIAGRSYRLELDSKNIEPETMSKFLSTHMESMFYRVLHCRQTESVLVSGAGSSQSVDTREFIESLSRANRGSGSSDNGWEVRRVEKNGQLAVYKDGLTLWVWPPQFSSDAEAGKKGSIAMVKEYRALLPGFYMANGNAPLDPHGLVTRFYWNVRQSGATELMNQVTLQLNESKIPFQFKILSNPDHYSRIDAGVLYINKQHVEKSGEPLARVYRHVSSLLKPQTSLFAKELAPGVCLAEDPNNGESFGQHRAKVLASALQTVHVNNIPPDKRFEVVSEKFEEAGIDIDKPYLKSGSVDDYDLLLGGAFTK
jgi:hypothetical protein